jgi:hypothetical protein
MQNKSRTSSLWLLGPPPETACPIVDKKRDSRKVGFQFNGPSPAQVPPELTSYSAHGDAGQTAEEMRAFDPRLPVRRAA